MDWVEVEGNSVDEAVDMAMAELDVKDRADVNIEIIREPTVGFLGMGGKPAIVRVTKAPGGRNRRGRGDKDGRRRQSKDGSNDSNQQRSDDNARRSPKASTNKSEQAKNKKPSKDRPKGEKKTVQRDDRPEPAPIEEQAKVATGFLVGLLDAFGLEGTVESRIDDEVLYLDIRGGQTEALVGAKGSVMYAVLELTRTVVQRKTYGAPRMRIDINGYGERRREALKIYAGKLADQVKEDGSEIMLEPMNAADRKVVHDAVAEIDGVRSFSEGDDPRRAVVIAFDE
ncbi:MAG: RNA-binding cell elongation regulator Jag/EloR [Acidimicrobiia bacterium]